jgi:hypothetical protein
MAKINRAVIEKLLFPLDKKVYQILDDKIEAAEKNLNA